MDSMINADKGIPPYLQVKQILMDGVRGGKFKPGNAIPSERELAEKFGLNRLTVRRAVDELVNEGYLVRNAAPEHTSPRGKSQEPSLHSAASPMT